MNAAALLERISAICLALPEAGTRLSHGAHGFHVAGKKMFAYFADHGHHGAPVSIMVKTSGREEQEMLIEADPGLYYWPAYIGVSGWIGIRLDGGEPDWDHIEDRVRQSYRLAAPKRLARLV
ncbi:MmcQ/YjbR family DNA-binding protein [Edaphosphingomonas haloaromaticamans]